MTREEAKAFYPILQAFADGKVIETRTDPNVVGKGLEDMNDWTEMNEIEHWNNIQYRVKPEPTYRSFKDAEECWKEMLQHNPLGWFKDKKAKEFFTLNCISDKDPKIKTYEYLFNDCVFMDGSICGVKLEE